MDKQKKNSTNGIKPGLIVPCVCAAGLLTACFTAFTVGSQAKEPEPIPATAEKSGACDVHFAATKNRCPQ